MVSDEKQPTDSLRFSEEKDISPDQLNQLFNAIGWKSRDPEKWKKALEKSSYVTSVWDGEKLIGMGRILEDGIMAMFYDIGVDPKYQKQGVGQRIVNTLIDQVKDKGYVSIGLFGWEANPENIPFYERFGFEKAGTGMELTRYMVREDL